MTNHVASVVGHRDNEVAVPVAPWHEMCVVCVSSSIRKTREQGSGIDRRPWPPRLESHIHAEPIAPVTIGCRHSDPLPIHVTRLHRELGPVPLEDWCRGRRDRCPTIRRAVFGLGKQLAARNTCQVHTSSRMWTVPISTLASEVLFEGVREQVGVCRVACDRIAVDRCNPGVGRPSEVESRHGVRVVGGEPCFCRMPPKPVRWVRTELIFHHLDPIDRETAVMNFATHRPEPCR